MSKDKQLELDIIILKDTEVSKEVKINILLEMIYLEEISLAKARELCMEAGIFTNHWMNVEKDTIDVYNNQYKKEVKNHE